MSADEGEHTLPEGLDLVSGDVVVLVAVGGTVVADALRGAVPEGVTVEDLAPVEHGLGSLPGQLRERQATVVVAPGLLGRWLAGDGAAVSSVRTVVAIGGVLDAAAAANWEAALGAHVDVVAGWPGCDAPAWEVEARLTAVDGVTGAAVGLPSADGPPTARVWVVGPDQVDRAALEAIAEAAGVDLQVEQGSRPAGPAGSSPNDELDRTVAEVAARVLGAEPLAADDPLLDHGLDATAAAWIVHEVGWRAGVHLRAGELIEAGSVRGLTALVHEAAAQHGPRPVTVRLAGDETGGSPLLLLHEVDGSPFSQLALARTLDDHVVGFESPLLAGGPNPFEDLGLMAMRYLVDIRRVQPRGPYRLAGRGFGGALAYEVARQLTADGAEVQQLVVADVGPAAITDPVDRLHLVRTAAAERYRRARQRVGRPLPIIEVPDRPAAAEAAHRELLDRYRWPAAPLSTTVVVGWSDDTGSRDATLGWGRLTGGDLRIERLGARRADHEPDGGDRFADLLRQAR